MYKVVRTLFYALMSLFAIFMVGKGYYIDSGVDEVERSKRAFMVDDLEALLFIITSPLVFLYYLKKTFIFIRRRRKPSWLALLIHGLIIGFFVYYFVKSIMVYSPG